MGVMRPPQTDDVVAKLTKELGVESITKFLAINLEDTVETGNDRWIPTRIAAARTSGDVQGLLRPLFCTEEINLGTSGSFDLVPGGDVVTDARGVGINAAFLATPFLGGFGEIEVDDGTYTAATKKAHQRLLDDDGQQLVGPKGPVTDTLIPFIYPEVSSIDAAIVNVLVRNKVVSRPFAEAVLSADLTQPIFSEGRCTLLDALPKVDLNASDVADRITKGVVAALQQKSPRTPIEDEVLGNLTSSTNGDSFSRMQTFSDACSARAKSDPAGFMDDMLKVASQRRAFARKMPIVEHQTLLPVDDLDVSPDARLDPTTCQLR
jgi:hypothetical protein